MIRSVCIFIYINKDKKAERRQKIRDSKHERANSIIDAKKGYHDLKENDAE
ncbi:hypothetical protein [Ilyomonas limi]|uniref:hypothetical protein n=1 Tax=Ilyomonas limi TaxID=2575867 RepID=UPI001484EE94|nr:hypothetical protein [Ilyomonas limi]